MTWDVVKVVSARLVGDYTVNKRTKQKHAPGSVYLRSYGNGRHGCYTIVFIKAS